MWWGSLQTLFSFFIDPLGHRFVMIYCQELAHSLENSRHLAQELVNEPTKKSIGSMWVNKWMDVTKSYLSG